MITKSKNSMLSNSEELDSESRTSDVTRSKCPKMNFTSRSLERLWKLKVSKTSNNKLVRTLYSAVYVGEVRMTQLIL